MKPWHCCYNPLEVIGAGQGGDLPFHLLPVTGQCQGVCEPPGWCAGEQPLQGTGWYVVGQEVLARPP